VPRRPKTLIISKKEVGQRLRAIRLAQDMSQVKLAELLGITQSNVSGLERGVRSLTIHQVAKLAKALGVTTDELLLGVASNGQKSEAQIQDRRFLRRLKRIDAMSRRQKDALLVTIDNFLKASHVTD
jgi:transcriptional regulator with XRE-family HTH domain